jgi:hypothetical protein
MTELHTPVVDHGPGVILGRPLHRDHGGMVHILPNGLEEVPPVVAGGNDVLQASDGWETVVYPSARVGGVVISEQLVWCKCGCGVYDPADPYTYCLTTASEEFIRYCKEMRESDGK